jgi:hypothetical protein
VSARLHRLALRIAHAALDRLDDTRRLTSAQRAWLLEDVEEDLAAMVDDAENRWVTEQTAREMLVIRALVGWIEGGDPPPADAIGYLERVVGAIPRDPGRGELVRRNTYLTAIGELGGSKGCASGVWADGDDERARPLRDFKGGSFAGRWRSSASRSAGSPGGVGSTRRPSWRSSSGRRNGGHGLAQSLGGAGRAARVDDRRCPLRPADEPGRRGFYGIEPEQGGPAGRPSAGEGGEVR